MFLLGFLVWLLLVGALVVGGVAGLLAPHEYPGPWPAWRKRLLALGLVAAGVGIVWATLLWVTQPENPPVPPPPMPPHLTQPRSWQNL